MCRIEPSTDERDIVRTISTVDDKDEINHPTMESELNYLSDSHVHPRNKINSFQWLHIHSLLTTHVQSQPKEQNNEVLSQLLQRMMTILDECFDSHTPIPNKRLLHSSLSQLAQYPSLDPKIKRKIIQCLASLETNEEGPFIVVPKEQFESMEATITSFSNLQQQQNQLQAKLSESEGMIFQLEKRSSLCDHFRVSESTVTRINSDSWASCFTKPVSKGVHRLSIKNTGTQGITIGVCDVAEYPTFLTTNVNSSPNAAMMLNFDGSLCTAGKYLAQNTPPQNGQEWSAEADLEKRTLHFFIDGIQQPHFFINIPVPLVFAIDTYSKNVPIEITFWGGEDQSHVTFDLSLRLPVLKSCNKE
ncbi:hypothetical protein BLNAU_17728 [Blattamonas nauphoetae]|uniref:Uncharacterized protein n=1 Tax=Blattamonas nauphoetae TaxID=2049346 RepID=A0ABQ9X6D8_9EUKA|nr:hypothetical protein BLNAU_17728 [Blattamonas nauphoetae]